MLSHKVIELVGIGIAAVVFFLFFAKRSVITKDIGMKNYKGYQQYGIAAKQFFDEVKTAFQNNFRYTFDRDCPNYYFAKIYAEDPRYILVIDLGNLSAAAIVNEFQFPPKSSDIQFSDGRTNRMVNWLTDKKMYIYREGQWELVLELERNDILDMLMEWGFEATISLEHAYALSYPNAGAASGTELALCQSAAKEFALETAAKAGAVLKFKEED